MPLTTTLRATQAGPHHVALVWCLQNLLNKNSTRQVSSTEAELVGVADCLPKTLSHDLFMDAQGYPVKNNTILQDKKSAILLETNGRKSCSKRSRHFNVRCFFIKYLVDKHDAEIEHCAT